MKWDEVVGIGCRWPGVEEGVSYGTPALKVREKLITRLRTEDNSLVLVGVALDEREILVGSAPQVFHWTDHYRDYPAVLARLDVIQPDELEPFLYRRWRSLAARRALAAWDAGINPDRG